MVKLTELLRTIYRHSRFLILILTPILLLPILIFSPAEFTRQGRCAFVLIWMAIYWSTEVIPIPVTSLFPVIWMPILGVMPSSEICPLYFKDITLLFIGGLTIAVAVEHWNLHKRIGLKFLLLFGSKPSWMMLGFMLPTWFLSMWLSNTATTAMMVPIAQAVIEQLNEKSQHRDTGQIRDTEDKSAPSSTQIAEADSVADLENPYVPHSTSTVELQPRTVVRFRNSTDSTDDDGSCQIETETVEENNAKEVDDDIAKSMHLCICYAATIGGIGTLTGSPTNLLLSVEATDLFAKYGKRSGISFTSWMFFCVPISIICLLVAWIYLQVFFIGPRTIFRPQSVEVKTRVNAMLKAEYGKLGKLSFAEIAILIEFTALACLWLTRAPEVVPGWSDLIPWGHTYITDATVAISISSLLFVIPAQSPFKENKHLEPILTWKTCVTHLPWGVILLLGGGFAMAGAVKNSGLSVWLARLLQTVIEHLPIFIMVLLLSALVAMLTEFTSNTATATMLIPILANMSENLGIHPLMLMFPAILSCSFAFMLPVATPPNAIVFSYGKVKMIDMIKAGFFMNLICVVIVSLAIHTWGAAMFQLHILPWSDMKSTTAITTMITTSADSITTINVTNSSLVTSSSSLTLENCLYNITAGLCQGRN